PDTAVVALERLDRAADGLAAIRPDQALVGDMAVPGDQQPHRRRLPLPGIGAALRWKRLGAAGENEKTGEQKENGVTHSCSPCRTRSGRLSHPRSAASPSAGMNGRSVPRNGVGLNAVSA